ncbi:major facilitator superfamily domain-containing protein [Usnea florida]
MQAIEVGLDDEPSPQGVLAKIVSRKNPRISVDLGPPPDGGLMAWTQVLMGHLIIFNTWGYINSFGLFQVYHVDTLGRTPSDISWVGSIQIFLLFFVGTFSGRATDYGLFRLTLLTGSILQSVGVFMTSFSTKYWQFFLAQGICTGLGNGLIFCPALSLLSTYFSTKRSLAIGIAGAGTATGGTVFPVIVQQLLPKIGFPWTVRVVGFVMFTIQCVTLTFAKPRLPPCKTGPMAEWRAFKELPYALFAIAMFLSFWGTYFAFYYVSSFGRDILGIRPSEAIDHLLILNGVGVFGRLIPAYLADRYFGPLNTMIPITFVSCLLLYWWAAVRSKGGLVGFAVIYGLFASGIQSLFPATLASLTSDLKKTGVRMGMVFSVVSFACLTGPPLAGILIQKRHGSYLYAQIFAGSVMLGGCVTLLACRVSKTGWSRAKV